MLQGGLEVGGVAEWLGLWLADFPRSVVDKWPSWVRCPLWVNQPGQLSLPSLRDR